jgi:hypothetical protein
VLLSDLFQQPVFAKRLAKAARQKVEREHSWDVVVGKTLELAKVNPDYRAVA